MMTYTDTDINRLIGSLWNVRVIARGLVKKVYEGEDDAEGLLPGQVLVNTKNEWEVVASGSYDIRAWVVTPYGLRPDTTEDQKSPNKIGRPFNQHFGFYGMPRIGDSVLIIGLSVGEGSIPTDFFVLGSIFSSVVNRPPLTDKEDLQMVHRSGASIRLNDTFEGGGAITDASAPEHMGGLTGNLSMVGNRVMMMAGEQYLMHGLVAKYGDPDEDETKMDLNDSTEGYTYDDVFSTDTDQSMFSPFSDTLLGTKKFLRPPLTTDSIIPLTDNTLLLAQHGGGVIRLDDHSASSGFTRLTASAASMSFMVGEDYKKVGLGGDSTATDNGEAISSESGVMEFNHESGTYVKINPDGSMEIRLAAGKDLTINDPDGGSQSVKLGEAAQPVVRNNDDTTTVKAEPALMGPPGMMFGNLGVPMPHQHKGHSHKTVNSQDETYV